MKFHICRMIAMVCLSLCALSVAAQTGKPSTTDAKKDKGAHFSGPLSPTEMESIQVLGRTLLAAQQSATPDPTREALRKDLLAMSAALDQALAAIARTPLQLHGEGRAIRAIPSATAQTLRADATNLEFHVSISPDGQITQQAVPPLLGANTVFEAPTLRPATRQETAVGVDHMATVRGMLATAKQHAAEMTADPQPTDEMQKAHNAHLLSKSKALHEELEAVMNGTAGDAAAKLAQLRERLHPKNLREVFAEREAGKPIPESTPTISTLTRHR